MKRPRLWRQAPDLNGRSISTGMPLEVFQSAENGELQKVIKWLHQNGPIDALYSDSSGSTSTLLHTAAANDHLEMVRELLARGASVDLPSSLGDTALMNAVRHGRLSVLHVLLQRPTNLELRNSGGDTALMVAAYKGQVACVVALLGAKANPDVQDGVGCTVLMMAAYQGHDACVQALLRAKANTELQDRDGHSALMYAAFRAGGGDVRCVHALVEAKANTELQDSACHTALMFAAFKGHQPCVQALLRASANTELLDNNGSTALSSPGLTGSCPCGGTDADWVSLVAPTAHLLPNSSVSRLQGTSVSRMSDLTNTDDDSLTQGIVVAAGTVETVETVETAVETVETVETVAVRMEVGAASAMSDRATRVQRRNKKVQQLMTCACLLHGALEDCSLSLLDGGDPAGCLSQLEARIAAAAAQLPSVPQTSILTNEIERFSLIQSGVLKTVAMYDTGALTGATPSPELLHRQLYMFQLQAQRAVEKSEYFRRSQQHLARMVTSTHDSSRCCTFLVEVKPAEFDCFQNGQYDQFLPKWHVETPTLLSDLVPHFNKYGEAVIDLLPKLERHSKCFLSSTKGHSEYQARTFVLEHVTGKQGGPHHYLLFTLFKMCGGDDDTHSHRTPAGNLRCRPALLATAQHGVGLVHFHNMVSSRGPLRQVLLPWATTWQPPVRLAPLVLALPTPLIINTWNQKYETVHTFDASDLLNFALQGAFKPTIDPSARYKTQAAVAAHLRSLPAMQGIKVHDNMRGVLPQNRELDIAWCIDGVWFGIEVDGLQHFFICPLICGLGDNWYALRQRMQSDRAKELDLFQLGGALLRLLQTAVLDGNFNWMLAVSDFVNLTLAGRASGLVTRPEGCRHYEEGRFAELRATAVSARAPPMGCGAEEVEGAAMIGEAVAQEMRSSALVWAAAEARMAARMRARVGPAKAKAAQVPREPREPQAVATAVAAQEAREADVMDVVMVEAVAWPPGASLAAVAAAAAAATAVTGKRQRHEQQQVQQARECLTRWEQQQAQEQAQEQQLMQQQHQALPVRPSQMTQQQHWKSRGNAVSPRRRRARRRLRRRRCPRALRRRRRRRRHRRRARRRLRHRRCPCALRRRRRRRRHPARRRRRRRLRRPALRRRGRRRRRAFLRRRRHRRRRGRRRLWRWQRRRWRRRRWRRRRRRRRERRRRDSGGGEADGGGGVGGGIGNSTRAAPGRGRASRRCAWATWLEETGQPRRRSSEEEGGLAQPGRALVQHRGPGAPHPVVPRQHRPPVPERAREARDLRRDAPDVHAGQ